MHLAKLKVAGFRNLRAVTLTLTDGLNVLVGPNNIGKTNVLEALRIALGPAAASDGSYVALGRDDFYRTEATLLPTLPIRIDLTFQKLEEEQLALFHELLEPNLEDILKSIATLHFEATWDERRGRAVFQRWGGSSNRERAAVTIETLQALPVTFLPALRDAEAALTPGYRNRLAHLFRDRIERRDRNKADTEKDAIVNIYEDANKKLIKLPIVRTVQGELAERVRSMSGTDFVQPSITASPPEFHRILRSLCLGLANGPVSDVASSGLGYSNILYIGSVLTHLSHAAPGDVPLLVVEEPEAHLHPQLVQLLASQLESGAKEVQTLVSTHSPTLAASVDPRLIRPMFRSQNRDIQIGSIGMVGLDDKEARQLRRMMDLTRAALLFAKAALLVEGISEALLIPNLALRLGIDLGAHHVSVIPISGVGFGIFKKLLGENGLQIPTSIITDSDPPLQTKDKTGRGLPWEEVLPQVDEEGLPVVSDRAARLLSAFENHKSVSVHRSSITLEHDLAAAGVANHMSMVAVWSKLFTGTPRTLNSDTLQKVGTNLSDQALAVWRGICLSSTTGSKAEFAHLLAESLELGEHPDFKVPSYISEALRHACGVIS